MKTVMKYIFVILCMFAHAAYALDQTKTGFFYPIGKENFEMDNGWWLSKDPDYFSGEYHIGVDMMTRSLDAKVYAIADGKVTYVSRDTTEDGSNWGIGNCALGIQHKTSDGTVFTAVYGHLQCSSIPARNTDVYAGKPIGKTGPWSGGIHLHFGIVPASSLPRSNWGKMPVSEWNSTNSFIDPVEFIETNYAYNPSVQQQIACQGNVCWSPKDAGSCEAATSWYKMSEYPAVGASWMLEVGSYICTELQSTFRSVAAAENPSEAIPDGNAWHSFTRFIRSLLGKTANAQELAQAMSENWTINTINVYTGDVVAGNASKAIHGAGQGYPIQAMSLPVQIPPDFITNKTWLVTPWDGVETYKFGFQESFDTKAQSENIGDGSCNPDDITQDITGHFYLSKGYKEDVHSGDGAWRRVDSTTTQCDNLKPGDTHTETKNTVISQWIDEPGIYNIVYCIDHPQDDHNNGGDHQEKHESNNCSTEAVFEVTANPSENHDPRFVDFVTSGLRFQQAPYYAGDPARFGATVSNQGNADSPADIRSSYSVQCPGTDLIYLADDGTMASTMAAGASAFEENIGTVTLPNVAGACTAYFCADYQGAVSESDEGNNCTSLSFTLQPRPAPKLVITKFRDESGCCTTNLGSRIKPDIWVRNDGPVAPGANVTVIYHIASPIATGGAYALIGYGSIRPSELPPGGTDEDYMDGSWSIPKNNAWKNQWHTVRGCLKADGSTPVGDPNTEICAYYTRYSKK